MTPSNITCRVIATGILPLNLDIFIYRDFAEAFITDRPRRKKSQKDMKEINKNSS